MFSGETMPTSRPSSTTTTAFVVVPLMISSHADINFSHGDASVTLAFMIAITGVLAPCAFIASMSPDRATMPMSLPCSSTGKSSCPV
jgi:hypothetical protein